MVRSARTATQKNDANTCFSKSLIACAFDLVHCFFCCCCHNVSFARPTQSFRSSLVLWCSFGRVSGLVLRVDLGRGLSVRVSWASHVNAAASWTTTGRSNRVASLAMEMAFLYFPSSDAGLGCGHLEYGLRKTRRVTHTQSFDVAGALRSS